MKQHSEADLGLMEKVGNQLGSALGARTVKLKGFAPLPRPVRGLNCTPGDFNTCRRDPCVASRAIVQMLGDILIRNICNFATVAHGAGVGHAESTAFSQLSQTELFYIRHLAPCLVWTLLERTCPTQLLSIGPATDRQGNWFQDSVPITCADNSAEGPKLLL